MKVCCYQWVGHPRHQAEPEWVAREGESMSAQTRAVGGGVHIIILKGYQERIRRRDSEVRGEGATGRVGTISVAALHKGMVIVT